MKKHGSYLLIFLLYFYPAITVALELTILQKGTGDPVVNATVVLENAGDYGETDNNGQIRFNDVTFPEKIKILSEGYETLTDSLDSDVSAKTFYITPLSTEGELIEVVEERVKDKTSKVILRNEEMRRTPGTQGDPLKAIQSLPGVVTGAEGTGIMYIRGSEPNQSIVWVNRARIGYLYHFGGLHSTIAPQLVSDFNMFLGGFPVQYGDALGGALDVKLRTPKKDRWHQNYSLGTYESTAVLEGPVGKKNGKDSMYIAARRSYIDAIFDPESFSELAFGDNKNEEFRNEAIQVPVFYDVQGVWQRDINKGRLLFQHFSAGDSIKIKLNEEKKKDPSAAGTLESSISYHSTSFVWEQSWSKALYSVSSLYLINTSQKLRVGVDENGKPFYLDIDESDLIWQPELRWTVNDATELVGGVENIYAQTPVSAHISRPPTFDDEDYNLTTSEKYTIDKTYKSGLINPYIQVRKTWFDNLVTQFGLRHSYLKSNGRNEISATSPRASIEYSLTPKIMLTGVWGRYLQLPDGSQWVREAGNPDLEFLEAEHRIAGIRYKYDDLWSIQFEAYHKPMKNLVVTYDDPAPDNYKSSGTGRAYGFDLLVKREYSGKKMGWMSYSYLDSKRTEKGITFPFAGDQRHTFTLVWSQPLPGDWKRWSLGFRARLSTGKPYTKVIGRTGICQNTDFYTCNDQDNAEQDTEFSHWEAIRGARNGARLPNYYQFDVRVDREYLFNTWKMSVYLDILNVLNIQNITGYGYGAKYQFIENPTEQVALPIFPSFGIEIEL